jgi:DNA mismatch repair ATPase MutS
MLGEVDAYISLGNYAFNNPDFVYPVISDNTHNTNVFSVKNLGHQLIEESKRVCNDFVLESRGTVCIISGANMAGKSTFLRTIAVNYILGMAGAPVCATEMSFIPSKLFTSMRTTDSLSDNESYFYAELKRLKTLKSRIEKGEPVFFILDEILKGTNSADKSSGSKLFLKKLIENGGTGLIATHDTSLGEMESDYGGLIINKCFEIEIEGEIIKFDYKLQNGITKKMNAGLLMKQMGILD